MIGFKIGEKWLDLLPQNKLNFRFQNNFFNPEIVQGSFAYNLDLPYTPNNIELLGHIGRAESTNVFQGKIIAELHLFSNFIGNCEISVLGGGPQSKKIKVGINVIAGDFLAKIANKTLKDICTDTYTIPYITYKNEGGLSNLYNIGWEDYYYCNFERDDYSSVEFTYNPSGTPTTYTRNLVDYDNDLNKTIIAAIEAWNAVTPITNYISGGIVFGDTILLNANSFPTFTHHTPFSIRFNITAGGFYDPSFFTKRINQLALQRLYDDFVFLPVYNPDFYDGKNNFFIKPNLGAGSDLFVGHPNRGSGGVINFTWDSDDLDTPFMKNSHLAPTCATVVPFLKLTYVISKIFDFAGYTVDGELFTDSELSQLVIYNTTPLDKKVQEFTFEMNEYNPLINYVNHLPDWSAEEFLNAILFYFGLQPTFSLQNQTCELGFRNDAFSLPVLNVEPKMRLGDESIKIKTKYVFKFSDEQNYKNPNGSLFFPSVQIGTYTETEPIEFKIGTLKWDATYPAIDNQKANSELYELGDNNDFEPKLAFARIQTPEYDSYLTGKPEAAYNYSLALDGAKGIIALWQQKYYDFQLRNKNFEAAIVPDIGFFKKLFTDQFPKIGYDYLDYLIETCEIDLENKPNALAQIAKLSVWKIPL